MPAFDPTAKTQPPGELSGLNTLLRGTNGATKALAELETARLCEIGDDGRRFIWVLRGSLMGADAALVGLAWFILRASPSPPAWAPLFFSAVAVMFGSWLSCLALVICPGEPRYQKLDSGI
jgi:ABC-type tungstate transport system substrate-binding protein